MSLASYRAAPSRGEIVFIPGSSSTPNAILIATFPVNGASSGGMTMSARAEVERRPNLRMKTIGTIVLQ